MLYTTEQFIRDNAERAMLLGLDLSTPQKVEELRARSGGVFGVKLYKRNRHWDQLINEVGRSEAMRQGRDLVDEEMVHNLVTNQGLNYILDAGMSGATAITSWRIAAVKTNTTPAAGMTYATPTYTEIAGSDVTETIRQTWGEGGASSQQLTNASPATYTANTTVTLYGASIVGGGTALNTIANTAGGGTLFCYSLFGASKAMTATDTIDITYTITAADA